MTSETAGIALFILIIAGIVLIIYNKPMGMAYAKYAREVWGYKYKDKTMQLFLVFMGIACEFFAVLIIYKIFLSS